jgi:SAM-dependent methyltransferase
MANDINNGTKLAINHWDQIFAENNRISIWPWSDVVSYTHRYSSPTHEFYQVLELGCGASANIPFFLSRNNSYHSVEGSPAIVSLLKTKFPQIAHNLICGDFTSDIPFNKVFDAVIDRASLTHNDSTSIDRCVGIIANKIRPNGIYLGIDWFST